MDGGLGAELPKASRFLAFGHLRNHLTPEVYLKATGGLGRAPRSQRGFEAGDILEIILRITGRLVSRGRAPETSGFLKWDGHSLSGS